MSFETIYENILEADVDSIVVPANRKPLIGYRLDAMIYTAAGYYNVIKQREEIGSLEYGEAAYTDGFKLTKYLIHTATPKWIDGKSGEIELLKKCYINSLKCAETLNVRSVAFPLLVAGAHKFPNEIAIKVAEETINSYLSQKNNLDVYLVLYKKIRNGNSFYKPNRDRLQKYINECWQGSFSKLAEKSKTTKATVSKIRGHSYYHLSKELAIALAIAMELPIDRRADFIHCAGYQYPIDERDEFIEKNLKQKMLSVIELDLILADINPDWILMKK